MNRLTSILILATIWLAAGPLAGGEQPRPEPTHTEPATTEPELMQYVADSSGFHVNSVLIAGATEAILVDAQYLVADAQVLADRIANTGKRLKAIFITHPDHDHYAGALAIVDRFPGTPVYMTAAAIAHFEEKAEEDFGRDKAQKPDLLADSLVSPELLPANRLSVDGVAIDIIPDLQGDVLTPVNSAVWIPSQRTLITGDLVFNGVHAWLAASDADTRSAWRPDLKRLIALQPARVIAGHKPDISTPDSPEVLQTMIDYLADFDAALATATDVSKVVTRMQAQYPWAVEGLLKYSAGVAMRKNGPE